MTNYDSLGQGIFTYLDCSTSHITREDDEYLSDSFQDELILGAFIYGPLVMGSVPGGYGYFVYCDTDGQTAAEMGISETLHTLLTTASSKGCSWLKLSPDGTLHPTLPTYAW